MLESTRLPPADLADKESAATSCRKTAASCDVEQLAAELQVGPLHAGRHLAQLARPGRDPREDLPPPIFKKGVLKLDDLAPGMELSGTVLNVVDFGAFVDIGLHDSGLVHISQLANRYVRDPHEVAAVGDMVKVWVQEIDKTRRRVSLTMIAPGSKRHEPPHRSHGGRGQGEKPAGTAQGDRAGGPGPSGPHHGGAQQRGKGRDRGRRPQHQTGPMAPKPTAGAATSAAVGEVTGIGSPQVAGDGNPPPIDSGGAPASAGSRSAASDVHRHRRTARGPTADRRKAITPGRQARTATGRRQTEAPDSDHRRDEEGQRAACARLAI